jgi:uncharacterized glyoxalase superfamily protein PhnB
MSFTPAVFYKDPMAALAWLEKAFGFDISMLIEPPADDPKMLHARQAGAIIEMEPADQFYGDRTYRAKDLEGHVWTFSQTIRQVSREEAERISGLKITGWV